MKANFGQVLRSHSDTDSDTSSIDCSKVYPLENENMNDSDSQIRVKCFKIKSVSRKTTDSNLKPSVKGSAHLNSDCGFPDLTIS